ncbi:hypothetical protein [Microviridae sp.]|nr:hypothetical protein [Microviridae sp.]
MRKFRNNETWHEVQEAFTVEGQFHFKIRATGPCTLLEMRKDQTDYPVGFANKEEIELQFPPQYEPRTILIEAAKTTRVFISHRPIQGLSERVSLEKFTTLDRPSPLSPEMAAIHRLARKNELEREAQRNEMERRERILLEKISANAKKDASTSAQAVRTDGQSSAGDAQGTSEDAPTSDVSKSSESGSTDAQSGSSGPASDEGGQGKGDPTIGYGH